MTSVNKKSYKTATVATNSIGAGKTVVSGSVAQEIADEILRRADALNMSKSRYAAKILETWYEKGCPPVTEPDRLMRIAAEAARTKETRKVAS